MTFTVLTIGGVITAIITFIVGMKLKSAANKAKEQGYQPDYTPSRVWKSISAAVLVLILIVGAFKSLNVVQEGEVRVFKFFGEVVETNYPVGFHFVPPFYDHSDDFNIRNITIEFTGENTLDAQSGDGVYMARFDLNVPYRVSEVYAYAIIQHIGSNFREQVRNSARSAARTVFGRWNWKEAASSKQGEFAQEIKEELEKRIQGRLIDQGVEAELASSIFIFSTPEVRKLLPPQAIRDAGAEREAAVIERERQVELTKAEAEIAKRQAQKGKGINNLLDESGLPTSSRTPANVAALLHAHADLVRAEALSRMARQENSPINWGVIGGSASIAVTPTK